MGISMPIKLSYCILSIHIAHNLQEVYSSEQEVALGIVNRSSLTYKKANDENGVYLSTKITYNFEILGDLKTFTRIKN